MRHSKIVGLGHYVPEKIVTNEYLSTLMDTNDKWIVERTGIEQRRWIDPAKDTAANMAARATRMALERARLSEKDIDFIVFATITPDYFFPGSGVLLGRELGLEGVPALERRGWEVRFAADVGYKPLVFRTDTWRAEIVEEGKGWFHLSAGFEIDGETFELQPILTALVKNRFLEVTEGMPSGQEFLIFLPDGRGLALPVGRFRRILTTLGELLEFKFGKGPVKLGKLDAALLAGELAEDEIALSVPGEIADLGPRLRDFERMLADEGTLILKFYLHIDADEQRAKFGFLSAINGARASLRGGRGRLHGHLGEGGEAVVEGGDVVGEVLDRGGAVRGGQRVAGGRGRDLERVAHLAGRARRHVEAEHHVGGQVACGDRLAVLLQPRHDEVDRGGVVRLIARPLADRQCRHAVPHRGPCGADGAGHVDDRPQVLALVDARDHEVGGEALVLERDAYRVGGKAVDCGCLVAASRLARGRGELALGRVAAGAALLFGGRDDGDLHALDLGERGDECVDALGRDAVVVGDEDLQRLAVGGVVTFAVGGLGGGRRLGGGRLAVARLGDGAVAVVAAAAGDHNSRSQTGTEDKGPKNRFHGAPFSSVCRVR